MDNSTETIALLPICPFCHRSADQVKAGISAGKQRFKCRICKRRYTLDDRREYPESLHGQARQLQQQGTTRREIARKLGVSPQTITNWLRRPAPTPLEVDSIAEKTENPLSVPRPPGEEPASSAPEPKRATIKEVARHAGVSTATVSNYLNDRLRMGEATRVRIERAIEELHFTPSALVRAIRQRRTRILGVLLWSLNSLDQDASGSLAPPLLAGISSAADEVEHDLLLYTGWPDRPRRQPGLEFLNGHIDGLLWVAPAPNEPVLERLAKASLPVVALLSRDVPEGIGFVQTDNATAMRTIVTHLYEGGHRRIAFTGPMHSSDFRERRAGYRDALATVGLPYDPLLEVIAPNDAWSPDFYRPILAGWLRLSDPPTAIVLPNDGLAATMAAIVRAAGLRVPEDISITGFDDIPDAERMAGGLTTIHQPFREIGQTAVHHLLAMIDGAPCQQCRTTLPGTLVVRTTTSPCPGQ